MQGSGLPDNALRLAGRIAGSGSPKSLSASGFTARLVRHESMELVIPPQANHRLSFAIGRRPGVWTNIRGSIQGQDLEHLNVNIVPASHTTWVDDPTPGQFLFVEISPLAAGRYETDGFNVIPAFNCNDPVLRAAASVMIRLLYQAGPADDLRVGSVSGALATRLRVLARAGPTADCPRLSKWQIRQLVEYIMANLHRTMSVERLAEIVDLMPVDFLRAFAAQFDMPPFRFIAMARMRDIRIRLTKRGATLSRVCLELGYSPEVLDRWFAEAFGITIAEYLALRS